MLHKQRIDSNGNAFIDSDPLIDNDNVKPEILDYYPEQVFSDKEKQQVSFDFAYLQAV